MAHSPHPKKSLLTEAQWQSFAICRGLAYNENSFETFFPERGGRLDKARNLCVICPVRVRCLDFALNNNIIEGVWGGKSERQRRVIKRRYRREAPQMLADLEGALNDVATELANG